MVWAPDYVTSSELKAYLRITDTVDDAQLAVAISAASRAVDRFAGRQFGVVDQAEERFFTARWDRRRCRWTLDVDDLMTAPVSVEVEGGTITAYDLEPVNAAPKGQPWTSLAVKPGSTVVPTEETNGVAVTALWGWSTVPVAVKQATLMQASRFHSRRDSPYGVAGSPEDGSETRLLATVDPDVKVSLDGYRRRWAAA